MISLFVRLPHASVDARADARRRCISFSVFFLSSSHKNSVQQQYAWQHPGRLRGRRPTGHKSMSGSLTPSLILCTSHLLSPPFSSQSLPFPLPLPALRRAHGCPTALQVSEDLEEALRVVQRGGTNAHGDAGAGSLEQLRFTKCRLQTAIGLLSKMEAIEAAPARVQSLLSAHSLPQACQAVVEANKLAVSEQVERFGVLGATQRRLAELWEMCYTEGVKELKRLVFGCFVGKDGKWRALDDWLKVTLSPFDPAPCLPPPPSLL